MFCYLKQHLVENIITFSQVVYVGRVYYHCFPSGASATLGVKKETHDGVRHYQYGTDVVEHRHLMLTETSSSTGVFPHKSFFNGSVPRPCLFYPLIIAGHYTLKYLF